MIQDSIFEKSEADNYFLRNKEAIDKIKSEDDMITQLINKLESKNEIKSVIDLGSSNGYRLNFLKDILPKCTSFVGVEPSKLACEDGRKRYSLEMIETPLDKLNLESRGGRKFDMVIINFVFTWIDRKNIFKVVENIDSLLNSFDDSNGVGYLVIGDFLPFYPHKVKYHHLKNEEVYTYKIDYTKVFKSLNTYKQIYHTTYTNNDIIDETGNNTPSITVLKKDLYKYYQLKDFK